MIVKNEAHVIERCLDSVKPLINYVLICDTGSTDKTISIIESWLAKNKIEGKVLKHQWKNFAANRSMALEAIRATATDYALMIDADEVLQFDATLDIDKLKENLVDDWYDIRTVFDSSTYCRAQVTSNKKKFYYKGVVHEYLECDESPNRGRKELQGIRNYPKQDSDRNRQGEKTRKDAVILEKELQTETDLFLRSRYTFYLAQSYRECGENRKALKYYMMRMELGGWEQECYCAALQAARLKEELNYLSAEILDAYWQAHEICPKRVEALYYILSYCRRNKRHNQGQMVGLKALELKPDPTHMFMDPSIFAYKLIDELSINSYWFGDYKFSKQLCLKLISENKAPSQLQRFQKNLKEAEAKL